MIDSFFRGDYMPHGHCYLWQPHILWTHVLSDAVIALSYFSIPFAILLFVKKRADIKYHSVLVLFSLFILLCGITHVFGMLTIWHGIYGWHGLFKALTAAISLITAIYIYRLLPDVLSLPSPAQFNTVKHMLMAVSTERNALESERDAQRLTQFMLNASPVSMLMIGEDKTVLSANQTFKNEFGYSEDTLSTLLVEDIISINNVTKTDLFDYIGNKFDVAGEDRWQGLANAHSKSGKLFSVELSIVKGTFEGQLVTIYTFSDLTEIESIQEALVKSHERLNQVINATKDGIWQWHVPTDEVFYSPRLMNMIGCSVDKKPNYRLWHEHIHPDHCSRIDAALAEHFKTRKQFSIEYIGRNESGNYGWFHTVGNTEFDSDGKPQMMSGSLRYIDDQKTFEQEFRENVEFLQTIYEGANQGIWVLKVEPENTFRFVSLNKTAAIRTGVDSKEMINKSVDELTPEVFPPEAAQHLNHSYRQCVESKDVVESNEMYCLTGEEKWYQITLYPILNESNEVDKIVGTAIDISEQKQVEKALENKQLFLQQIIDSSICGLYIFCLETMTNIRINQRYTDILGYTMDDFNRKPELLYLFHPDEAELIAEHINTVASSKQGDLIPIDYRFRHKDGHWVCCQSIDTVIEFNKEGKPTRMLGTFVDITKQANLMDKLKNSNDYLERFAFAASHDLQEPLRKIIAFSSALSDRLSEQLKDDEVANFEFSRLISATQRMRVMINDILKLSRINQTDVTIVQMPLNELVSYATEDIEFVIKETQASINVTNGNLELSVDKSLMAQVLQNLIHNSIKFRKDNTSPIIDISAESVQNTVEILISDNGIGITHEHLNEVFNPFRRLNDREKYQGSGIGLSICKQIINVHRGQIDVTSDGTNGCTFSIKIPIQR